MKKKDDGISLIPWFVLYFFVALCLFLMILSQNIRISTKFMIQDGLAAAALAGEVVDLDVLSRNEELVITDVAYARSVFEDSLQASLCLDEEGYPDGRAVRLDPRIPVEPVKLVVYNVSGGMVYQTDLLTTSGKLHYDPVSGLIPDAGCRLIGPLLREDGSYALHVTMLDGENKEIRTTALYGRIRFGIKGFHGNTIVLEKDILTDIQENEQSRREGVF